MDSVLADAQILDEAAVRRKIKRMALEIAEQNTGNKQLVIAGIVGNGSLVAALIASELKEVYPFDVTIISIVLNKANLAGDIFLQPAIDMQDKVVIIADDVANTGKTMFFALKPFLQSSPKKIQTLALVERSHKEFPIHTDYTGLSIATTLQEHITVKAIGDRIIGAWLH